MYLHVLPHHVFQGLTVSAVNLSDEEVDALSALARSFPANRNVDPSGGMLTSAFERNRGS